MEKTKLNNNNKFILRVHERGNTRYFVSVKLVSAFFHISIKCNQKQKIKRSAALTADIPNSEVLRTLCLELEL